MYTTPTCHYCKKAKTFFNEKGVEFTDIDVAQDVEAAEEMVQKSDQMGVPVITVTEGDHEHVVIGFNEPKLRELLDIK